jgi:uncharacterized membrane protein YhaH (DUF805 family)
MQPPAVLYAILAFVLAALSARSALVVRRVAPWTASGWWLTVVYCVAVIVPLLGGPRLPAHGEYVALIALTVAFVIAGVKDEPQAEPWYLPRAPGPTRAQKRANGARS